MNFLTVILFLVYTYGLGFSLARIVIESENFLERNLMRIGIGLGSILVLGLILNISKIPLDWRLFLILSLFIPVIYLVKKLLSAIKEFHFDLKITKYDLAIVAMLLIFSGTFLMYYKGTFSYPWLEDEDPWAHALGVKYVSVEKKVFAESPLRYIDPYPPSYDMLLGILHQTNDSMYWTLKFFNVLIISLSIIFFFFFVKELAGKNKALFSTFVLASVPAYLSHFIWAIALNVPLYFVSFYALERIKYAKKWSIVAAVMISASLTISPSHSIYFGLLFVIYFAAKSIAEKKILVYQGAAGLFGLLLSLFLWWLPAIIKHGIKGTLKGLGTNPDVTSILNIPGTADKIYNLQDFFIAQKVNMINNPIGIGLVVSVLLVIGLISIVFRHYSAMNKSKLTILVTFLVVGALALLVLSHTYVKHVTKGAAVGATPPVEKGTVPFFEFFSDQIFVITTLLIMLLLFISLVVVIYKNHDMIDGYLVLALAWLIFSFLAVNAGPYYYKITPFRVWSILAMPVAILASEGMWFLLSFFRSLGVPKIIVMITVLVGVVMTSTYQKYSVNTDKWGPGGFWTSYDELEGYLWIRDNLPKNSKLFTFVNNGPVVGMDMFTCHWCSDVQNYQKNGFNQAIEDNYDWLKRQGYQYIVIDGQTARRFGQNETNTKLQELQTSNKFEPLHGNRGMMVLKIL